ncbi:uncharacterized protein [Euphorbia lathyris]|uniref:uncharacterized protein n=1 Tax=Euphorbia lathyris TaxID=212925 RepID=UPI0033138589
MGKQTKSKTTQSFGKGKVTPMQIAFIVDRYLSDNSFNNSRSAFRTEASSLISKSPVNEAPKSLLSLGALLNEYISLKEQKIMVDQEKVRLEQEKVRVQNLLQGMQSVMNVYNASGNGNAPSPMIQNSATRSVAMVPQPGPSAGGPIYSSQNVMPVSMPSNITKEQGSVSTSVTTYPLTRKRAGFNVVAEVPSSNKKSRGKLPLKKMPNGTYNLSDNSAATQITQPQIATNSRGTAHPSVPQSRLLNGSVAQGSVAQGSSVAKSLFKQSPKSSTGPTTPPQEVSFLNDQTITPVGTFSAAHCSNSSNTPVETPTNCTVITSERVTVSPCKHVTYTMERNQCISSSSPVKTTFKRFSKRENVKGRLDFDGTDVTNSFDAPIIDEISTSESDKEADIFDLDLDSFETFGSSFSELLIDLDLGFEGLDCPCEPNFEMPADTSSGSSHESRDGVLGIDQVTSDFSSALTEVMSGKDVNIEGPDTLTAVRSVTKCIILSPSKTQRTQENSLQRNTEV